MFTKLDHKWMSKALELAQQGAGYVSPNPLVGCVIISEDGVLLGKGYHERYGKAHAEINALASVKDKSRLHNATVYVTLEPCAHHGKTPPCADALAQLPFKKVIIALRDPNPKVNGKGIKKLQDAGIEVAWGLLEQEARVQNEVFLHHIQYGRPFVCLKMAQTLDGFIAAADGSSQWITSEPARRKVHEWRAVYDAVMVGRTTALTDNPRLTVRHVEGRQPARIVVDGPGLLPSSLHLFSDQYADKTYRITHSKQWQSSSSDAMLSLLSGGVSPEQNNVIVVNQVNGHADLEDAFGQLLQKNIASILVEAGSALASAMLRQRLVDKLHVFIAPKLLGSGERSILGLNVHHIEDALPLARTTWEQIGEDMLCTGYFS